MRQIGLTCTKAIKGLHELGSLEKEPGRILGASNFTGTRLLIMGIRVSLLEIPERMRRVGVLRLILKTNRQSVDVGRLRNKDEVSC